ncbi:polyketide cyclase [Pseudoluteimonas lycopersici]|uniref:Polyketide cyclase n=1 Tax=Pseudoluteimonas lycopersici TaxID=1324796 RepID=A0A516V849_9GAMM|nr:SRPBCC family protein [Lysobacter lycopersici]QDQ74708.1 polyketide cyclase [Lysobacter lycopersici]
MTRLIEILISLAIVAVLFVLVSLVLPSHRHLSKDIETNRKLTTVYDTLNSLKRFKDWNVVPLRDPRMALKLSGPESGNGARLDYDSDKPNPGQGSWQIVASTPGESVTYALTNPERGSDKKMTFKLEPTGRGGRNVKITQTYDVDYGWDLLGRYAGLYVGRHVGDDMKLGLERLSNMLASVPNVDYSNIQGMSEIHVADVPAMNLLVVSAGSIDRDDDKLQASMRSNMEWINRNLAANGLSAAGPMRIITSEMGRENYTFDVAVPVRKGGASTAKADDKSAPAAATPAPAPVVASAGPLTGLKLTGPVKYVQVPAGRAVTATYTGYWAGLETVHNALRAWAMTNGYEPTDRPYDAYTGGIDNAFTENGKYEAYWGLK